MFHSKSKDAKASRSRIVATSILVISITSGCASYAPASGTDLVRTRATAPFITDTHKDLAALPQPRGIIRAAVYSFRDQTGQYKPNPSNNLSTSVTQGADSILLKALIDSRWFAPVERANLQNLLTERKILQSSSFESEGSSSALTPVAPAQVIFEGSVVSYDSNIHTGGSGIRILGIGASQSYREDRVTLNLRLVDIDNGLVLHSIMSTKSILSRKLDNGVFSYVDSDKILELEAGYTFNEPSHIAVTEAIESALINLVAEGVISGSMQLANPEDVKSPSFSRYISEASIDNYLKVKRAQAEAINKRNRLSEYRNKQLRIEQSGLAHLYEPGIQKKLLRKEARQASIKRRMEKEVVHQTELAKARLEEHALEAENTNTQDNSLSTVNSNLLPESLDDSVALEVHSILKARSINKLRAAAQAHDSALYAYKLAVNEENARRQEALEEQN